MGDEVFRGRLLPGERTVWSGRPASGLMFTARDFFLVPFSVVWIGFAVIWTGAAVATRAGIAFAFFGLMFVAFGATIMWGRFWFDAWLRGGTRYALNALVFVSAPPIIRQRFKSLLPLREKEGPRRGLGR